MISSTDSLKFLNLFLVKYFLIYSAENKFHSSQCSKHFLLKITAKLKHDNLKHNTGFYTGTPEGSTSLEWASSEILPLLGSSGSLVFYRNQERESLH